MASSEQWNCPICCELLYKPSANKCGHLFCFWCLHRAMNPYSPSKCPLCRSPFTHFPAVCTKLHSYLAATFPEDYARRAAETAEEEAESGAASPDLSDLPPAASAPGAPAPQDFQCDACLRLLLQPCVLNCGHVLCEPCAVRWAPPGEPGKCLCPACDQITPDRPAVCKQLEDLIAHSFPAAAAQRAQQAQQAQQAPPPLHEDDAAQQPSTSAAASVPLAAEPAVPIEPSTSPVEPAPLDAPVSSARLAAILGRDTYTHFGVGCDVCGQYPIVGRRYKCLDCPEAIGFDLCAACNARPAAAAGGGPPRGRFNQRHTPEHRVTEVRPRITGLHMLRAMNPELSFEQLTWLLELSAAAAEEAEQEAPGGEGAALAAGDDAGGSDADGGDGAAAMDEAEGQAGPAPAVQAPAPAAEEEDPPIPTPRRGPRPAFDSTAVWPSPSAAPPNPPRD